MSLIQVVISSSDLCYCLRKHLDVFTVKVHKSPLMLLAHIHEFERPNCPPRTENKEGDILKNNPLLFHTFQLCVILQQVCTTMILAVLLQLIKLKRWLLRKACRGPHLAMRMRIGATHSGTFVLEDLHVPILLLRHVYLMVMALGRECGWRCNGCKRRSGREQSTVEFCPCLND